MGASNRDLGRESRRPPPGVSSEPEPLGPGLNPRLGMGPGGRAREGTGGGAGKGQSSQRIEPGNRTTSGAHAPEPDAPAHETVYHLDPNWGLYWHCMDRLCWLCGHLDTLTSGGSSGVHPPGLATGRSAPYLRPPKPGAVRHPGPRGRSGILKPGASGPLPLGPPLERVSPRVSHGQ